MQKFFCRILSLTLLFTSIVPTDLQAQTRKSKTGSTTKVISQAARRAAQAQQQNTPTWRFYEADKRIRSQHEQAYLKADKDAAIDLAAAEQAIHPKFKDVPADDFAFEKNLAQTAQQFTAHRKLYFDLVNKVKTNEITLEEIMEYMDPMNPSLDVNNPLLISYAAEVLGNTADYAKMYPLFDTKDWQNKLPEIEARLLYRLALLGQEAPSYTANQTTPKFAKSHWAIKGSYQDKTLYRTTAIGSLRIALLKIHQYYQAKGQADPVEEYQKTVVASKLRAHKAEQPPVLQDRGVRELNIMQPIRKDTSAQIAQQEQAIQKQAANTVAKHGNLADFSSRFISELRAAKDKKPEEGSSDYQLLQIMAEYATAYAIEYDPKKLKTIVGIFDEGVKRTLRGTVSAGDFHRDYSPILNAIFNTIFENTRYSAMGEAKTKQMMNLLADFSDPEKYSLPTRIFSLEAASLLFRPFHQETLQTAQQNTHVFAPLNFNKPDENLRRLLAARVVELYCPLTNQSTFGMQTYGLSASEMQALADQLAYIYDGFYDISTTTISMPGQDPHQAPTQCVMVMKNQPNQAKKTQEAMEEIFWFTASTVFWTFGGDLLMCLGTAFRLSRGAIIALPAATKAARAIKWGEKAAAFNNKLRDGAKYANWVYKMKKQQGVTVEFERLITPAKTVKEVRITNGVAKEVEVTIQQPVTKWETVTTTHQLQGKYSAWNPKRWWSDKARYNNDIVSMRVTQIKPDFKVTQGTMKFETPVSGLNSLADISRATRQLELANGNRMWIDVRPYWTAVLETNQAMVEQSYLRGIESSLDKTWDVYVPLSRATGAGDMSALSGAQNAARNSTRWVNKSWGFFEGAKFSPWTKIYVAPKKAAFQASDMSSLGNLALQDGIENVPNILPGFYSTVGDLVSGNIQRQAFRALFNAKEWTNPLARTFLPDYVPTKLFWQATKTNPMFGINMVPKLLWRNRLLNTTAILLAWKGSDEAVYPLFKSWLETEQNKDLHKEFAKYGDAFDPASAKRTEQLLQDLGVDMTDKRAMQAYDKTTQAAPESGEGTLMSAPIIVTLRFLGMELLNPAIKTNIAHQAQQTIIRRANAERMARIVKQQEAAFKRDMQQQYDQIMQEFKIGLAQKPALKKQLARLFQNYIAKRLQVADEKEALSLDTRFVKQCDRILEETVSLQQAYYAQLMQDQINQQVEDELQRRQAIANYLLDQAAQQAQSAIANFHEVAQDTSIITPAVEQQIRNAYATAAHKLIKTLQLSEEEQEQKIVQINQELDQTLDNIWQGILEKHPELSSKRMMMQAQPETNEVY